MIRDNDITLYNIFRNKDGGSEFHRTVMYVHLEETEGKSNNGKSETETDVFTLFVPFSVEQESGKIYMLPEPYERLDDRSGYFTFKKGDIVVKGVCEDEITSEKEFVMNHPEAVRIRNCDTMNFGSASMRHWEVHCD